MISLKLSTIALLLVVATSAQAQQGYEFEVYTPNIGSPHETELELKSNYVADGLKQSEERLDISSATMPKSLSSTTAD